MERKIQASVISIATDVVLILLKSGLAWISASVALTADALHSVSDLLVSVTVFSGIWLRARLFGSGPGGLWIETGIALFVALLILFIPFELLQNISNREPRPTRYHGLAIAGILMVIALIYFVSRFKIHVGRETGSPALEADGYHSRVDMLTSIAVLAALTGDMVGLELETLVTLLIAVMIGLTGMELAISAGMAIFRGRDIEEFSMASAVTRFLGRYAQWSPRSLWRNHRKTLASVSAVFMALMLVLASIRWVGLGQRGHVYRLGALQPVVLEAGWHLRWPYPLETLRLENSGEILNIPFNVDDDSNSRPVLTADNALVDIGVRVHVTPGQHMPVTQQLVNLRQILQESLASAVRSTCAGMRLEQVLSGDRQQLIRKVTRALTGSLKRNRIPVTIRGLYITRALPPETVIHAFRDLLSADQERQERLHQALLYRNEKIPAARAEASKRYLEAEADSATRILRTRGMVNFLSPQIAAYKQAPDITETRLRLENSELTLTTGTLVVADSEVNRGDYRRHWFTPEPRKAP